MLDLPRLVLASASPRRAKLLSQIGLKFEIHPSDIIEESPENNLSVEDITQYLACQKARAVSDHYSDAIVIGADTLVSLEDEILGKPINTDHAHEMLIRLSGICHKVVTGISLINTNQHTEESWVEVTDVYFRHLSKSEIAAYVQTGEAADKAGAYGIQGRAAAFVKRIEGCYFNVVGLPLASLVNKLMAYISDDDS